MTTNEKKNTVRNSSKKKFNLKKLKLKTRKLKANYFLNERHVLLSVSYDGKRLRKYAHNEGSCRAIYKLGDVIIKIEESDEIESTGQTQNEIAFYKRLKEQDAQYFPKLIASSMQKTCGIIVQEFVPMIKEKRRTKDSRKLIRIMAKRYEISDLDHTDNYNWGISRKTGKPVIFDMGFT